MSLLTTIYKFIKPELTDSPPDITATNENWDKLDVELKSIRDADAAHKAENASNLSRPHGLGSVSKEDYEIGTWTPSLNGNHSYTTRSGRYIKIGDIVFLDFRLLGNKDSAMSGNVTISGVPFTIHTDSRPGIDFAFLKGVDFATAALGQGYLNQLQFIDNDLPLQPIKISNAFDIRGSIVYRAN